MKKFLSVMLAVIMVFSCTIIVSAEDDDTVITKQPTAYDPSVEVSNPDSVESYQWYKLGGYAEGEISDKNANPIDIGTLSDAMDEIPSGIQLEIINQASSYDSTDGWTPAVLTLNYSIEGAPAIYAAIGFSAELGAGSTVSVELNIDYTTIVEDSAIAVLLLNFATQEEYALTPDEDGKLTAEVNEAGEYWLAVAANTDISELCLKAFGTVAGYEPIEGETDSALSEIAVGENYRCAVTLKDGTVLYSNSFKANYEIISQPTAADPTFEVTFEEDASFQWYEAIPLIVLIDDVATDVNYGTYDAETGEWTPDAGDPYEYADYEEYEFELFDIYLEEGQTVKATISNPDAISPEDPDLRFSGENHTYHAEWDENGVATFTAPVSDVYYVYQYAIYPETATFKFETSSYGLEEIESETEKTLQSPELGKFYAVSATYEDETVLRSDVFEMEYAITKQPTAEDLSVEVNFADDVEAYQWYNVVIGDKEVTEENADPSYYPGDSEGDPSYYDEENGYWVGSLYDTYTDEEGATYYEYDIFNIELQEGDILTLTPSADVIDNIIYTGCDSIDSEEEFLEITNSWVYEDGTYTFVAPYAETFYLYVDTYTEDITFTAALKNVPVLSAAIEGEDEAALKAPEADTSYACIITYKNGIELVSDFVTLTEDDIAILGDVNGDGEIDQYDYILVKRHYFETRLLADDEMTRADVNKDSEVDQFDYILIARHYFGTYEIK